MGNTIPVRTAALLGSAACTGYIRRIERGTKGESHGKDTDNTGILGARCHMRGSHEESVAGEQDISYICDIPRHFLLGMHMAVLRIVLLEDKEGIKL